jgi:hypothetical protein
VKATVGVTVWNPAFVSCLGRLADYRGIALPAPERFAGNPGSAVRGLAAELDMPVVDLFVLAQIPIPSDLLPVDKAAGPRIEDLVEVALDMDGAARSRLLASARSVVAQPEVIAFDPIPYGPSTGALIYALLLARNLDHHTTVRVLALLTGRWVAASVIRRIGDGYGKLTPDWLADLGTVLGIPARLLSAMTGLDVAEVPRDPAVTDAVELIWAVRRLTYDQVNTLVETAQTQE